MFMTVFKKFLGRWPRPRRMYVYAYALRVLCKCVCSQNTNDEGNVECDKSIASPLPYTILSRSGCDPILQPPGAQERWFMSQIILYSFFPLGIFRWRTKTGKSENKSTRQKKKKKPYDLAYRPTCSGERNGREGIQVVLFGNKVVLLA